MVSQEEVTSFYDNLVFPSRSSHNAYENLVSPALCGKRVGDFGCGQSLFQERFQAIKCEAVFLDISENALAQIGFGEKINASLLEIPLPDDNMDAVFCIGVVHHIPEMANAIGEIIRVLKPGARLYLGVYASGSIQSKLRNSYDRTRSTFFKSVIWNVSKVLIWLKNRRNGLRYNSIDHRKRIDDLLITPLVRYVPVQDYVDIVESHGMTVDEVRRISQMNVLVGTKNMTATELH